MRRAALILVSLSAVFVTHSAAAACNKPDLIDAVPPDGAAGVPTNAKLFGHYAPNASYLDEPITFTEQGKAEQTLTGTWNAAETLLSVAPALEANAKYTIDWPRLRGINSSSLGRTKSISFEVGTEADQAPPEFEGLTGVDWDVGRAKDECTDSLEERYTFELELGEASDDGGRESLMLVLFQTRGPHVDSDAPEPVLVRRLPSAGKTVSLDTTVGEGVGDVCFAAVVRDLTGKASASGAREVCTTTVEPPFFNGCSTRQRSRGQGIFVLIALGALLAGRRW